MKKRKIIKRILVALIWTAIIIGACIFPYPALFMGHSLPKQPELSLNEKFFFDKLKKEHPWSEIGRTYINIDSLGEDIMIRDIPIDFLSQYRYTIEFSTEDSTFYLANNSQKQAITFAEYIWDSICFKSSYLTEMNISIRYRHPIDKSGNSNTHQFYQFLVKKDSLYLSPKGY